MNTGTTYVIPSPDSKTIPFVLPIPYTLNTPYVPKNTLGQSYYSNKCSANYFFYFLLVNGGSAINTGISLLLFNFNEL